MKTQRDIKILHSLFIELARIRYGDAKHWSKVSNGHKVSSYFPAGDIAVAAFANVLNLSKPMKTDGIFINPKNIRNAKTIGNIFGAIIAAYKAKGWTITI